MNIHTLRLADEPFEMIRSGQKKIESRLYDEKRKHIHVGDEVVFIKRSSPEEAIRVKVTSLLRYTTFEDMFRDNGPAMFGGPSVDWLLRQVSEFYTLKDQQKYGVVGIVFRLL